MFNLIADPWLPVLRVDGTRCVIRPAEIANPEIGTVDWPRADFRVASIEFLTGLVATAFGPEDERAWFDGWESPPDVATLDAALAPFVPAFNLDGDGPRFLQDFENISADAEPIDRLLIEAPGDSTEKKNTDLFVRRGRVLALGRPAAAMALYTFQSWAPAGGAGNRTGLRGGGPLITYLVPGDRPSLWQTIWANVPTREASPVVADDLPRIFPWLAPTLTSEGSRVVTPGTAAHPLQCWWGMPRRIRLDFVSSDVPLPCDLTGDTDSVRVVCWRQRPRGANYVGWGRTHPLTPHYRVKAGAEWLPLHPQPGGIGYRHWLGLVLQSPDGARLPAAAIATWRGDRARDTGCGLSRLVAAGFDMDNMKSRAFVESEMPLPTAPDAALRDALDRQASCFVQAADLVATMIRSAVRNALFSPGATVKADVELLASVRERLWDQTEAAFFDALLTTHRAGVLAPDSTQRWLAGLHATAINLFDEVAPLTAESGNAAGRISRARRSLLFGLRGFGKDGAVLFKFLELPAAESKAKRKSK